MTPACHIEENGRPRRVQGHDFPLAVGGAQADIPVPGLETSPPAAFLAWEGGELFVQPQGPSVVSLGGAPVTASQWLRDGDELRLLGTRIQVSLRGDGVRLRVEHVPLDEPTEPPAFAEVPPAPPAAEGTLIRPVAFRPNLLVVTEGQTPRGFRRPRAATLAAALALVTTAGFLLAARAVEVRVEPEPARLSVRGWLHVPFGRTRLMLPGRYAVVAERPGYRRLEATLEVGPARQQVARFVLRPLPGLLAVSVQPKGGVRVRVDGAERGTTPLAPLELDAGDHEVAFSAEGYAPFRTRVSMAGRGEQQTVSAVLVPDRAPVSFASEPAGAAVRVDGAEVGTTPLTVDLTSGRRAVEIRLAGFAPAAARVDVVAGRPLRLPLVRLTPLVGRVVLQSEPAGAAVSVEGAFRGATPVELELPPGKDHVLRLTKAGHDAAEARVRLEPGESRSLSLTLTPLVGEVEVAAQPPDAEVLVDGEPRGRVGQTLRLTAVPHTIELRRSGYEPHRATVTPRPGFPQAVRVRLRSVEEAKEAARPSLLKTPSGHELRLLAAGRFHMGASRREPGRRANETLREVELIRPFYLAAREVTNAQFRRYLASHSSGRIGDYDLDDDQQPVVRVSWDEAALYCNWLSAQEGLPPAYVSRDGKLVAVQPLTTGYRLPTEAEWSRSARYPGPGEGPLKYAWGNALPVPPRAGNFADESARRLVPVVLQGVDDRYPVTAPVGSFPPNALGLFDLGGNVAEWMHDVYAIPPAEGPLERDPSGPAAGDLHVILGASYLQGTVTELRLSYRDYGNKPRPDVGFRVARYAE